MKPRIENIEDVLPNISTENGICVSERENYTVIDYVYTVKETFDSDMALECRGLKFDASGTLIARPFHKFFNLGEREDPFSMDWSLPHIVMDKLDGTMIHPVFLGGTLKFMTRMGLTFQAQNAFKTAHENVLDLCKDLLASDITPMFEFTSPHNRVVIAYEKPELTFLAARETFSGDYLPHTEIIKLGKKYSVPAVKTFETVTDIQNFMREGRELEGVEGYVIAFEDGHRVKLKADGYVLRHRALLHAEMEKNVFRWVLTNAVDDVLPLLSPDMGEVILDYQRQLEQAIEQTATIIEDFFNAHHSMERKAYAQATSQLPSHLKAAAFARLDGKTSREAALMHLSWAVHSQSRIDQIRPLYGFEWSLEDER